jgi:alkylation response protein AidB-like acyl-CoA dehydrogenase
VDLALSGEQQELAATVAALLGRRADSAAVRSAMTSASGFDEGLWRALCDQIGAPALGVPEEHGGAGFTLHDALVVLEEVGVSLAPSPLRASLVTSEALLAREAPDGLLARVAAGEVATLAWPGPAGVPGPAPTVTATDGRLTGTVTQVLDGDRASVLVVAAQAEDGVALFDVDPGAVRREHTPAMDPTLRLATLTFEETLARRLTGDADGALARARLVGTAGVVALAVGCARRALDMTVSYSKQRVQFGRPIGSFQALKHRMADMMVLVEMSRSAGLAAARAVSDRSDEAERLVAVAAAYTKDALRHVAGETVQLHGGIAITWEHDAQLVLKRAHALHELFGQPHHHRAALPL